MTTDAGTGFDADAFVQSLLGGDDSGSNQTLLRMLYFSGRISYQDLVDTVGEDVAAVLINEPLTAKEQQTVANILSGATSTGAPNGVNALLSRFGVEAPTGAPAQPPGLPGKETTPFGNISVSDLFGVLQPKQIYEELTARGWNFGEIQAAFKANNLPVPARGPGGEITFPTETYFQNGIGKDVRDRLQAAGFGPKLSVEQTINRAKAQLASPNDAWLALQAFKEISPEEATSLMQAADQKAAEAQGRPVWQPPTTTQSGADIAARAATPELEPLPNAPVGGAGAPSPIPNAHTYDAAVERWRPLVQKYFPASEVDRVLYLINRESGGNPSAHNLNPATNDDSWGLLQINLVPGAHQGQISPEDASDPEKNIAFAAKLYADSGYLSWATGPGQVYGDFPGDLSIAGGGVTPGTAPQGTFGQTTGFGVVPEQQKTASEEIEARFRRGEISEAERDRQLDALAAQQAQDDLIRQRAVLDNARAQYKAQGYDVFGTSDGGLRVEDPTTGHIWTASVGKYGQLVESAPVFSQAVRARGIQNSVQVQPLNARSPAMQAYDEAAVRQGAAPPTLMRSTNIGDLTPEAAAGYLLSGAEGQGLAGVSRSVQAGTGETLGLPELNAFLGTSIPGTGADLESNAGMPADVNALMPADWRGQVAKAVTQGATRLLQDRAAQQAQDLNAAGYDPSGSGGFQTNAQPGIVLNKFGQQVDEYGYPDVTPTDNTQALDQLQRILALGRVAFANGGMINMGDTPSVQRMSGGKPSLTLNEPATVVGDITGKEYAKIGETGKRETLMPAGGSLRVEPTKEDITLGREHMLGFATGGLISSVPTVVGSLPDGSLLVKSQYSGVTHTITPEAFAMMPLDQRNALEQQVRNQALNAQNQAQQDAAEAKRRQQEAEAQQKASDAAQRQQLAVQQQILDAQMQEYQQGQTGADTRASLAGLAAPLTQSQYLQNFVLPAVQIAGGNTVLDASRTPRQQPSLYGPVTQNSAGLLTATRLNPRPTLNTQQALRGPNTRPSLLRLAVR